MQKKVLTFIDKKYSEIEKKFGNSKLQHFLLCATTSQFELPTEKTYNELIEEYNIDKMEGYLTFENLKKTREKRNNKNI